MSRKPLSVYRTTKKRKKNEAAVTKATDSIRFTLTARLYMKKSQEQKKIYACYRNKQERTQRKLLVAARVLSWFSIFSPERERMQFPMRILSSLPSYRKEDNWTKTRRKPRFYDGFRRRTLKDRFISSLCLALLLVFLLYNWLAWREKKTKVDRNEAI